ncbi:MAG: class I SAM-dependent DNA methyltransferase [Anaerolineae bacterium]
MERRHDQVRAFYEQDAGDYQWRRWFASPVAQANHQMTQEALLEALAPEAHEDILEVGCGPGTWTAVVAPRCRSLTAVDISARMVEQARAYVQAPNVQFEVADFVHWQAGRTWDKAFAVRVFEHFEDKALALARLRDLLRPSGRLVLITKTVPSLWNGRVRLLRLMRRLLGRERAAEQARQAIFWMERVHPLRLRRLLTEAGFVSISIAPVIFRPPIFARGEDEYPLIGPRLEKPLLGGSLAMARWVRRAPAWVRLCGTLGSESYLAVGWRGG